MDETYGDGHADALRMDEADPLAPFRDEFVFPREVDGRRPIYLAGMSLGLQPRKALRYVQEELEDWGRLAVGGHFRARRPWLSYHRNATPGLTALTGARPAEVVAMNGLTVNLHLMMTSFYRPTRERHKIVIEETAFPSDRYAVVSQIHARGYDPRESLLEWRPREDAALHVEDLERLLEKKGTSIALLLLPGVQYYNGQALDMSRLCAAARAAGCAIGLDLAHAIGNLPLALHEWSPDFAVWCSYKYLNGGPGAVGGAFVPIRHHERDDLARLLGWWGQDEASRFAMRPDFVPAAGVERWQLGNPPILSLAPVIASLALFEAAGIKRLCDKSQRLTAYLDYLLRKKLAGRIESITPPDQRGCQLSLRVPAGEGRRLLRRLENLNVHVDWREPDVIRAAPVPLYNSYADVHEFVERLQMAFDGEPPREFAAAGGRA